MLYEFVINVDCENVTNSHFLYMSIYWVSSSVTSRVQQAPGVCELDVVFSRDSLTHLVVISFVCSLRRRGIVHCETRSLEHACTTPGVSVMHRSRSDGLGHDRAQLDDSVCVFVCACVSSAQSFSSLISNYVILYTHRLRFTVC